MELINDGAECRIPIPGTRPVSTLGCHFDFACPGHSHLRGRRRTYFIPQTRKGQGCDLLQPDLICSLGGKKAFKEDDR